MGRGECGVMLSESESSVLGMFPRMLCFSLTTEFVQLEYASVVLI